jgi:hypothetical protein
MIKRTIENNSGEEQPPEFPDRLCLGKREFRLVCQPGRGFLLEAPCPHGAYESSIGEERDEGIPPPVPRLEAPCPHGAHRVRRV